jgi:pyruvate, water dikinase
MLGFRGASRYYSEATVDGLRARVPGAPALRDEMGFSNITVMVPFCRTPGRGRPCARRYEGTASRAAREALEVYMMCEIPSNVVLAGEFARALRRLLDRLQRPDPARRSESIAIPSLAGLFDEGNEAVRRMIASVIETAHASGCPVGLCGQAPSDDPEFARFLVDLGIDSISVSPDSFLAVKRVVADAEGRRDGRREAAAR